MKTAVIAGSSGLVGGHLLSLLLADARYGHIISIGRRLLPLQHLKLEQRVVDFSVLTATDFPSGTVDYFCCLGTTITKAGSKAAFREVDFEFPFALAKAASQNKKASFLIVTALGSASDSLFFYNRVKGELENALQELPLKSLHIFQPSLLLGNRGEKRLGEQLAQQFSELFGKLFTGPLKKYRPIKAEMVAEAMHRVALTEAEVLYFYPSSLIQEIALTGVK